MTTGNEGGAPGTGTARGPLRQIAVMGAGSWGSTFAKVLGDAAASHGMERSIRVWGRSTDVVADFGRHRNTKYLGDIALPEGITATMHPSEALEGAQAVVLAIPAQSLRAQLTDWGAHIPRDAVVLSLMKGLELGTDKRMSEVIAELTGLPEDQIAVLSGPNLALEIARSQPTGAVVACTDHETAQWIAESCTAPYFRPYMSTDVVGVEIGGIVKNVIALAVGICEGKEMGDNTKATVITRGLAETSRLAVALGGDLTTMAGLAGLGDLVATCSSKLSRNHTAGSLLGQGLDADQVGARMTQVAEGIKSAPAVLELAQRVGVDMPITAAVVAVLTGELPVDQLEPLLLARQLKSEGD